jgi:hypothetical protein
MRGLEIGIACVLAGCAIAESSSGNGTTDSGLQIVDSGGQPIDAPNRPIDAPADAMIDAPPMMTSVTLTQTTNNTLATSSLACGVCEAGNPCTDYRTDENAYYRVFDLATLGITQTLHITAVNFGVQEAAGTQNVQVRIGTYTGAPGTTLNTGTTDWGGGSITALDSATINVPTTTTGTVMQAPILADVPGSSNLIVEVFAADHTAQTNTYFFLGATTSAEQTAGYVRAPACSINSAETPVTAGQPVTPFVITVTGTY